MKTNTREPASADQWGDAHGPMRGILWGLLLSFGFWFLIALVGEWVAH